MSIFIFLPRERVVLEELELKKRFLIRKLVKDSEYKELRKFF
jgi:hypothetical protein